MLFQVYKKSDDDFVYVTAAKEKKRVKAVEESSEEALVPEADDLRDNPVRPARSMLSLLSSLMQVVEINCL